MLKILTKPELLLFYYYVTLFTYYVDILIFYNLHINTKAF